MRGQRTDRVRATSGPLSTDELEELVGVGWSQGSRRLAGADWNLGPEAHTAEALARAINDPARVEARLEELSPLSRAILSQVAANGGRMRGENLRRELLLRGFGDTTAALHNLVRAALLMPLPAAAEAEIDLETLIAGDQLLQRDLALGEVLAGRLGDEAEHLEAGRAALAAGQPGSRAGTIHQPLLSSTDTLELNLLHVTAMLRHEPLLLNKSGTPNRRSLAPVARGIVFPGERSEAGDALDMNDAAGRDYWSFVLALALELGLVAQQDHVIAAPEGAGDAFFRGDTERRDRELGAALLNIKYWSEVQSLALHKGRARRGGEEQFSHLEATGEPLLGARGYVFSVLRRARLAGWTPLDALESLCVSLDRSFLERTLSRVPDAPEPEFYVDAVLRRLLPWAGFLELGTSEDGLELARFGPRARRALNMPREEADATTDTSQAAASATTTTATTTTATTTTAGGGAQGCLIVQPNFEIMVFLDVATLDVLHFLYAFCERVRLSDRVATFRMTARSVQRGLGTELSAAGIVERLSAWSHTPLPPSVAFQLDDWERVQRRLALYSQGVLLRHVDVDKLDLIVGQIEHDLEGGATTFRLDANTVYIVTDREDLVARVVAREHAHFIDYREPLPTALYFVDPMVVMIDRLECDIVTLSELERIGRELEGDESSRFFELDVERIRERWPDGPLAGVLEFLGSRSGEQGVPASQAILLQSVLERPPRARMIEDVTVVVFESAEIAERFTAIPEAEAMIAERLGERAFSIFNDCRDELAELFEELKVYVGRERL